MGSAMISSGSAFVVVVTRPIRRSTSSPTTYPATPPATRPTTAPTGPATTPPTANPAAAIAPRWFARAVRGAAGGAVARADVRARHPGFGRARLAADARLARIRRDGLVSRRARRPDLDRGPYERTALHVAATGL